MSLTDHEKGSLDRLVQAWNAWCDLPDRPQADDLAFMDAIHRAQALIALRVARRADPDVWRQP